MSMRLHTRLGAGGVTLLLTLGLSFGATRPQDEGPIGLRLLAVATEAEAAALRNRIEEGEPFEALAREYSQDPSAANGGYLGAFARDDLRLEFRDALAGLGPGDLSEVSPISGGYFLFQILREDEQEWVTTRAAAESALRGRRYAEAGTLYETAVELAETFGPADPRLADSLYDLAGLRFIEGRFGEASDTYRRYMAVRWTEDALSATDAFTDMIDDFASVLSLADFGDEEFEQANAGFESALAEIPLTEDAYVAMASMLQLAELGPLAETVLSRGVEVFPESKLLRSTLGELYSRSGQSALALEAFEQARAIETDAGDDSALHQLQNAYVSRRRGNVLVQLGRPDQAIAAYTDSVNLNPDSVEARLSLADVYITQNDLDEALAELEYAQELDPRNAGVFAGLSEVHLNQGRFEAAVEAAGRALELDSTRHRARYVRGQALMRLGRREEGQAELSRYQQLTAGSRSAGQAPTEGIRDVVRRAAGLLAEGQAESALDLLRATVEAQPQETRPRLALGIAQRKAGLEQAALETFRRMTEAGMSDLLLERALADAYAGSSSTSGEHRARFLQMIDLAFKELSN